MIQERCLNIVWKKMKATEEPIPSTQWVSWIAATATAASILVSFVFSNFVTKAEAETLRSKVAELQEQLNRRLERIEDKIDRIPTSK
jgi:hypothetical protein